MERGIDRNGRNYFPACVTDGHISCMGEDYLTYVTKDSTWRMAMLGAPYSTDKWQYHDDTHQNGSFKMKLLTLKCKFIMKKRLNGIGPEILNVEIVVGVRGAVVKSCGIHLIGPHSVIL